MADNNGMWSATYDFFEEKKEKWNYHTKHNPFKLMAFSNPVKQTTFVSLKVLNPPTFKGDELIRAESNEHLPGITVNKA